MIHRPVPRSGWVPSGCSPWTCCTHGPAKQGTRSLGRRPRKRGEEPWAWAWKEGQGAWGVGLEGEVVKNVEKGEETVEKSVAQLLCFRECSKTLDKIQLIPMIRFHSDVT